MAKKKLVPLMPILVSLGACHAGCVWVRDRNLRTFRRAYTTCPTRFAYWLIRALDLGSYVPAARGWAAQHDAFHEKHFRATDREYRAAFLAEWPPHVVERALYDYAVREGLA